MRRRLKSVVLVALQFIFILLLLLETPLHNLSALSDTLITISILLVFWAIVAMQKSKLRILPEPSNDATLVTNGPYRFIRHPMYTGILLGCSGLLIAHFTWIRFAFALALAMVLIIKLNREEKMLSEKFKGYDDYIRHTSRLFPFLY